MKNEERNSTNLTGHILSPDSAFEVKSAETEKNNRLIAWNGVRLKIPASWEVRVSGQRHLVFEEDFQPQLQIRWEKLVSYTPRYLQKRLAHFASQMGSIIPENSFPKELEPIRNIFALVTCFRNDQGIIQGGICLCQECHTLVLFQILSTTPVILKEVSLCLTALSCHHNSDVLWRVQDFSLTLPKSFSLKDYTFGAGLTRLSFSSSNLLLQTCTLGPADTRLSHQSLDEILIILTGIADLEVSIDEDNNSCEGYRSPTIPKQMVIRLRREKSFVRAKIWHDTIRNRLLAVVLSSNRPIPITATNKICSEYEIV